MTMGVNPIVLVLLGWLAAAPLMLVLWFVQRNRPNASLADAGWCFGFAFVIVGYALAAPGEIERRLLVSSLAGIHAVRLGTYILFERVLGKTEDARYQTLRREWGSRAPLFFFFYFQSQAVAIAVFSIPLLVLMYNPHETMSLWELAGVVVWLGAVIGETMADRQLAQFRANPNNSGKTCRLGLWHYSRHPNYFFEGLYWSAYVLMGVGVPYGWLTLIGPLFMVWALLGITGIPRAEAQALASRGADYQEYQRTTSVFLPWFPKEDKR